MEPNAVTVDVAGHLLTIIHGLPGHLDSYLSNAAFADTRDLRQVNGSPSLITAGGGTAWPEFVAVLRSRFEGTLFPLGVALVPETGVLFVGGGQVARAYSLREPVEHLWDEVVECGFWSWRRTDDVMVMSAELELAAWSIDGQKLWTRFVEPPWGYEVVDGIVHLDVMGALSTFPLRPEPG